MGSGPYCAFHRIACLVDWHRTNAAFIQTQRGFSKKTPPALKFGLALWFLCASGPPQRTMIFLICRVWMPGERAATGMSHGRVVRKTEWVRGYGPQSAKRADCVLLHNLHFRHPWRSGVSARGKTPQRGHRAGRQPKSQSALRLQLRTQPPPAHYHAERGSGSFPEPAKQRTLPRRAWEREVNGPGGSPKSQPAQRLLSPRIGYSSAASVSHFML